MDLGHFYPEIVLDIGDVEAFSVVGDYDPIFLNIPRKIGEVLVLDIGGNGFSVIEGDRGYFIGPGIQSCRLDVQVSGRFPEFRENPPELVGW